MSDEKQASTDRMRVKMEKRRWRGLLVLHNATHPAQRPARGDEMTRTEIWIAGWFVMAVGLAVVLSGATCRPRWDAQFLAWRVRVKMEKRRGMR